jgi:hypothetical protein
VVRSVAKVEAVAKKRGVSIAGESLQNGAPAEGYTASRRDRSAAQIEARFHT